MLGGTCFRPWHAADDGTELNFGEVAVFAVDARHRGQRLGLRLMHKLQELARARAPAPRPAPMPAAGAAGVAGAAGGLGLRALLTYADHTAFGFFRQLGFSRTVRLPHALWKGRIEHYDSATVVEWRVDDGGDGASEAAALLAAAVARPDRCTSGRANCYCRSGRSRSILRVRAGDGAPLEEYCSLSDAARKLGLTACGISSMLTGAAESVKGHRFRYKRETAWRSTSSKAVCLIDPATRDVLAEYPSANDAARTLGLNNSRIGQVCNGLYGDAGGRVFRWKEQREDPCSVCGSARDGDRLLLCDGKNGRCAASAHTYCLGLDGVPAGEWYCGPCAARAARTSSRARPRPSARRSSAARRRRRRSAAARARARGRRGRARPQAQRQGARGRRERGRRGRRRARRRGGRRGRGRRRGRRRRARVGLVRSRAVLRVRQRRRRRDAPALRRARRPVRAHGAHGVRRAERGAGGRMVLRRVPGL